MLGNSPVQVILFDTNDDVYRHKYGDQYGELKKLCHSSGIRFVDAINDGVDLKRYKFRSLPHIVFADENGVQLQAYEANQVRGWMQDKRMVQKVHDEALRLLQLRGKN